ncbi:hypothetical protein LRR18_16170 [Mangrovimonas sp. AS39]|uniref:hypothetical protein n=1 Tax=Mangrovimonas futianensis TaxID=2895523 RepID=UPI001E2AA5BE|nr:hypothetical protein [Mangrovimonas futianensis]MCF1193125.1 hypothetical protein [Mangrovimonas futianensis]MCF1196815.1 hypothetical protein [Mangrovimonas futianensis]
MDCNLLNSIGLVLDIIGVIMLFKYGLPADVSKDGTVGLALQETNYDDIRKWKKYNFWSRFALGLLVLGFLLQIISNQTYLCAITSK